MVSGIDDRLHRQWIRPGQTLRARVNRRAREPPKVLLNLLPTNSRIVRKQQHHCENNELVELSVLRYKEQESLGNPDASCDSNSADWRSRGSELDTGRG